MNASHEEGRRDDSVLPPRLGASPLSMERPTAILSRPFMELSWTDRLLTPAILLSMIAGVIIGEFVHGVQNAFDLAQFRGVSARSYTNTSNASERRH